MNDNIQILDTIIEKSELALRLIEEQEWDSFIEIETQRQALLRSIKNQEIKSSTDNIVRLESLSAMNKALLEHCSNYQEQLKESLNKLHKSQSVNKAYQQ